MRLSPGRLTAVASVFAFLAGLAVVESVLAPAGGRHKGDAHSFGGSPARSLVLREWGRDTDYRMAPTAARRRHADKGLEAVYDLNIDAEGFIEPSRVHDDPEIEIVFLGGSTTECLFVSPGNRFPHLTARMLENSTGRTVNGLNAARSGNNAMHSLLLLIGKIVPLRPDVIVLSHAANDIGILSSRGTYWTETGSTRLLKTETVSLAEGLNRAVRALIPNTADRVHRAWRAIRDLLRASQARAATAGKTDSRAQTIELEFTRVLTASVEVAKAWGITPVLMTQVHVGPDGDAESRDDFLAAERLDRAGLLRRDFSRLHTRMNAATRRVASQTGAALIDLEAAREWRYGEVYDGLHFTDRGSRLAAGIIARRLREILGRDPSKPTP